MIFVKTKKLNPQANSDRVLILRQRYAAQMVELLSEGKRVVNIDETWLNETSFIRKIWAHGKGKGNLTLRSVQPRISVILAIDTQGSVWFA